MRTVPPGGHDKSPPQSRMFPDPEGVTTNLPKGHTSSSTLPLSLLTPDSLQSSLPRSQEVHIVHGEHLRSTFRPLICTHIRSVPSQYARSFQQPVSGSQPSMLHSGKTDFSQRCECSREMQYPQEDTQTPSKHRRREKRTTVHPDR